MSTEATPTPASDPVQAAASPRQRSDDDDGDVSKTASPSRTAPALTSAAAPAAPPPRPVSPPNQMTDPVSALQAMFPSMDRTIITEVLAAHGGNPDAASMALLELSDSSPATATTAAGTGGAGSHNANAQMLADEAYARELMAQMEREHMNEYGRPLGSAPPAPRGDQQQQQQQQQGIDYSRLNYTPRQPGQHVPSSGRGGAGSRTGLDQMVGQQQQQGQDVHHGDGRPKYQDELDQLTVQLEKFADTGKKTFNSLLSKAKDKYSEIQTQRTLQGAQYQDQQGHPRSSASGSGPGSVTGATYTQPTTIAGFTIPSIPAPWQGGFAGFGGAASNNSGNGNREGSFRPASPRDNLRSGALSPNRKESVVRDYSQSPTSTSTSTPSSRAMYSRDDLDDDAPPIQISRSPNSTPSQPVRSSSSTAAPILSSSPATAAPGLSSSPVPTRGAFGSSPAKVQMLPRQTINLMEEDTGAKDRDNASRSASSAVAGARATSPSSGTAAAAATAPGAAAAAKTPARRDDDDSDNESVEYVRNPFNNDDD